MGLQERTREMRGQGGGVQRQEATGLPRGVGGAWPWQHKPGRHRVQSNKISYPGENAQGCSRARRAATRFTLTV